MTPGPRIETRWVCIAASDQTQLAAQLSSYFNDPGVYFPVFQFPDLDRPHEEAPAKDGHFTQIIGKRAATWINNSLARIQPDRIVLLGLSDASYSSRFSYPDRRKQHDYCPLSRKSRTRYQHRSFLPLRRPCL